MSDRIAVLVAGGHDVAGSWARTRATAAAAHARGLGVLVGEHADRDEYAPSALSLAGALLAACPGLDVTTAGVIAGVRDPVSVTRDAAVVAGIAESGGGRFTLGLVAGYEPDDLPGPRHAGRFAALESMVAQLAQDRPCPVLVGGSVEAGVRRAACVDGWLAPTTVPVARIAALVEVLRAASAAAHVLAIRRWLPAASTAALAAAAQPAGSRTPPELLLGGGPGAVAEQLDRLFAVGVDVVALGPVADEAELDRLLADLDGSLAGAP